MEKKSDNSKSALSFLSLFHPILTISRAVAARTSAVNNPPVASNPTSKPATVPPQPPATRRDKKSLKGVVVKRKTKPLPAANELAKGTAGDNTETQPDAKRRKVSRS